MQQPNIIEFHKTRDFSNKMSVTLEFIRQNFKSLGKSILFIAGPPILLASLLLGNFMNRLMSSMLSVGRTNVPNDFEAMFTSPSFWLQIAVMFVFILVSTMATIATINNYIILYEEKRSNSIEVAEVWERVRQTFFMYLGTAILFGIVGVIAYAIMIVPVVLIGERAPLLMFFLIMFVIVAIFYLVVATSLLFIVRAYERVGFFEGLIRSVKLVQGKWWSTFGLIMILYLIVTISTYIFSIPYYVVTMVGALHSVSTSGGEQPSLMMKTASLVFQSFAYMCQMFLYTLPNVGIAFQYFNLVERKEARGLMEQIGTIGQQSPTAPSSEEDY